MPNLTQKTTPRVILPALLLAALALGGCNVTTSSGSSTTTVSTGTEAQLRASVRQPLRRAGVSDACIESLDRSQLTQVRATIQRSPRTSREVLQQNQQLRVFVSRFCPNL
jgi:hypothetical protein